MKRLALAAAGAAVIGLAGCSGGAPTAAPSSPRAAASAKAGHTTVAVSCSKQYQTWKNGQGKRIISALHSVSSAETAADGQVLTVALKRAKPVVARAAHHPVPACADPRGYWTVLLMHVTAAVSGTSSASSARAAMKGVPKIERQLITELRHASE
jgi:hypothetical protein